MVLLVGIYFFESGWAYKESFFTDLPARSRSGEGRGFGRQALIYPPKFPFSPSAS
jgi:hypothetical protein